MILSSVLTPLNDTNLRLAAQCGVEAVVVRYPGPGLPALQRVQARVAEFGLRIVAVEGDLPIERIKRGVDDGAELEELKQLIRNLGAAGVPLLCYNFMAGTDWVRTQLDAPERGGARTTAFALADAERAVSLQSEHERVQFEAIEAEVLWERLEQLLREIVPVAEEAEVTLAMHPDDPPLETFCGRSRIMNSVEAFQRLVTLAPSPRNAICFCQGSFATMGVDIPDAIQKLGRHIAYVHFRDVEGGPDSFRETFHDNGPTDMAAAIRAMQEAGFDGPIRPDHVPQLCGEEDGEPGYTMLGRLFAFGYIRGLLHGVRP